jgi:3-methyl-2-oxobutanoate hydroxymethyltransferase
MSHYRGRDSAQSVKTIQQRKNSGEKIAMVTCYDTAFARLIEHSTIDMVLVGDSLGSVMLGYEDTTQVTMDDMVYHTRAVHRGLRRPLLCADMPFLSYQSSCQEALRNAGRLIQEGGAQCVKLEGGQEWVPQVRTLVAAGIPVIGHLGLTPQSVHMLGGYRVQGRDELAQERMLSDARALQDAGVFALVLELIPSELAQRISEGLRIPTIGIGAGPHCDGQVLVLHDLLGFDSEFNPRFLKKYAHFADEIQRSLNNYSAEVKSGVFPAVHNSF